MNEKKAKKTRAQRRKEKLEAELAAWEAQRQKEQPSVPCISGIGDQRPDPATEWVAYYGAGLLKVPRDEVPPDMLATAERVLEETLRVQHEVPQEVEIQWRRWCATDAEAWEHAISQPGAEVMYSERTSIPVIWARPGVHLGVHMVEDRDFYHPVLNPDGVMWDETYPESEMLPCAWVERWDFDYRRQGRNIPVYLRVEPECWGSLSPLPMVVRHELAHLWQFAHPGERYPLVYRWSREYLAKIEAQAEEMDDPYEAVSHVIENEALLMAEEWSPLEERMNKDTD